MKLDKLWQSFIKEREGKGLYCCGEVQEETRNRCMCVFVTNRGRSNHRQKGDHRFPAPNLATHMHLLHLSGKFAFSLATGSMTNRCDVTDMKGMVIEDGLEKPRQHTEIREEWYATGCYRRSERNYTHVSASLIDDLEALFMEGFCRDGEKKGTNKYTAEQARAFLLNLRLPGGRRKYSHDSKNENGPLPTVIYIKSWFSRRKSKMANEERARKERQTNQAVAIRNEREGNEDNESDSEGEGDVLLAIPDKYSEWSLPKLKKEASRRMESLSLKNIMKRLLELDDEVNRRDHMSYHGTASILRNICKERGLPSEISKTSLVLFLTLDDKALRMHNHKMTEGRELNQVIEETLYLQAKHSLDN